MRKILFVDDDNDFLTAQQIYFTAKGDRVLTANNTKQALKILSEEEKPDVIILDLMMEHYDSGFSLANSIRKIKGCEKIPIVMISGVAQSTGVRFEDKETMKDWIGIMEFVNKPVDPFRIDDVIRKILKK